jgi:hypothetical protein
MTQIRETLNGKITVKRSELESLERKTLASEGHLADIKQMIISGESELQTL